MVSGVAGQLSEAIAAVDPQPNSVVVAELLAARERLEAKVCAALSGFLARGLHQLEGWSSPVGWLRAQGLSDPDAKRLAVRAARLTAWPELARLWFGGEVSGAQVDVVVRLVPKPLVDLFAEHDAEVSPLLVGLSLVDTTSAVRHWVARAEAVSDDASAEPGPEATGSTVHLSRTLDRRAILDAELDADTAAVAEVALRIAERPDEPGEFRTLTERRGDAFGTIVRFFCDHYAELGSRPGRQHPHVAVTIDPDALIAGALRGLGISTVEDLERLLAARDVRVFEEAVFRDALAHAAGAPVDHDRRPLSAASLARLFTEGTLLHRLLIADGQVIDRGRDVRLATPNLRDAMVVRDRGCRFPHCDAPTAWVHAHHLNHWDNGGPTDLANLAGLCATHHGVVHRHDCNLELEPDGTLIFRRPDGHTLTSPPPRRHRPPPLPLHHPKTRGLIPEFPEPARPSAPVGRHEPGPIDAPSAGSTDSPGRSDEQAGPRDPDGVMPDTEDPTDHETALMVRARVVDLVRHHHRPRRRSATDQATDPDTWPEAWPDAS
jgi:hypothetical protein